MAFEGVWAIVYRSIVEIWVVYPELEACVEHEQGLHTSRSPMVSVRKFNCHSDQKQAM